MPPLLAAQAGAKLAPKIGLHRADIDDLAATGRLHRRMDRLRAQERAGCSQSACEVATLPRAGRNKKPRTMPGL
jgi:hypothetical protein